jgi:hypothetical protein
MATTPQTVPNLNASTAKNDAHAMMTGDKHTKPEENYRPGNNDAKICHTCTNYENPSQDQSPCLKIVGIVHSSAVCDLWSAKQPFQPDNAGEGQHKVEVKIHTGTGTPSVSRILTERPQY